MTTTTICIHVNNDKNKGQTNKYITTNMQIITNIYLQKKKKKSDNNNNKEKTKRDLL